MEVRGRKEVHGLKRMKGREGKEVCEEKGKTKVERWKEEKVWKIKREDEGRKEGGDERSEEKACSRIVGKMNEPDFGEDDQRRKRGKDEQRRWEGNEDCMKRVRKKSEVGFAYKERKGEREREIERREKERRGESNMRRNR